MMQPPFNGCSDEELILRLRDGENDITDYIMEKYKDLVRKKAGSMYILGADREDLIQEGMIGLFKAIQDYDSGRDASFATFADLCVSRKMYTAVQASGRMKHMPLNTYISLSDEADKGGAEEGRLLHLTAGGGSNPEEVLIDKENLKMLEEAIERELSLFEKQVLDLHMIGMSYVQIAKILGRDEKSTDNAMQRIRNKLHRALKK